jgi:hypothetical protein
MSPAVDGTTAGRVAALLQATELVKAGRPLPPDLPSPKRLAKMTRGGWLMLSRAAKVIGTDAGTLEESARASPLFEVANAEPPRLLGIFRLRPEPSVRWSTVDVLERRLGSDPVAVATTGREHTALAGRIVPVATKARGRSFPGQIRDPPQSQRYMPPTPSREALLTRVDRSLVERYALDEAGSERRRRPPRSPLRFSDGYPAKDLSSALRLLVTVDAAEVADRMRSGTLASWFRDEAGDVDLGAIVDAAAHTSTDRNATDSEARAILLQYIRRTPMGADLERGLIEPMAEALRSRDGALVASTAEALLLLDSDLAAAELASALFETEVAGRPHVIAALGETGSPRAVSALERLAKAATLGEDREAALRALRNLSVAGSARDVASSALARLGEEPPTP